MTLLGRQKAKVFMQDGPIHVLKYGCIHILVKLPNIMNQQIAVKILLKYMKKSQVVNIQNLTEICIVLLKELEMKKML